MKHNNLLSQIFKMVFPVAMFSMYIDDPDTGSADLPGSDDGETIGTNNDARLRLLDQINDNNDRDRAEELRLVNDDDTTEPFQAEPAPDTNVDPEPSPDPQPEPEPVALAPAPKIKVNGEEVELTPELIAKAQKIASGDKYLEDAALAARQPAKAQPSVDPEPSPPADAGVKPGSEEDLALIRAIQMGTPEEAYAALQKLRQPQISIETIGRIADERLNFNTAIDWFDNEYADLVSDPDLHAMVLRKDSQLVKEGDKRSYKERYKDIGDEVRKWRDDLVKKFTPAPAADPLKTKEERKAQAPQVPVAASAKSRPAVQEEEKDESPSVVIANMAKARGGPQWARG